MRAILCLLIILCSCSAPGPQVQPLDTIDKLIAIHKTGDVKSLITFFNAPKTITKQDSDKEVYAFITDGHTDSNLEVLINSQTGKIIGSSLFYWENTDNYNFLKDKFKNYKWIETPIPSNSKDVLEEKFKVEIPEVGLTFEYDNQDPLRRVMWIFIN